MTSSGSTEAPIYDSLIEEHGDILAESRKVAEETQREAKAAIDFSDVRAAHPGASRS